MPDKGEKPKEDPKPAESTMEEEEQVAPDGHVNLSKEDIKNRA